MAATARPKSQEVATGGEDSRHPVTPLELFFDLVFVFAITQVTGLMAADPTRGGVGRGLLVLAALWWAWTGYAWLTNEVSGEDGRARLVVLVAMAAMLLVSLAVPDAFGERALLFGVAYLVVRLAHLALFWVASRESPGVRGAVLRLAQTAIAGPVLLVVAAAFDGALQAAVWVLALAIDYGGPLVRGVEGWRVHAEHFAERHGLIVLIALGESIVAIGAGASHVLLDLGPGTAVVLGVVVAFALWWMYFDVVAIVATGTLVAAEGSARSRQARDSYSYLHLPMVAGIVLVALGMKTTLAHVDHTLALVPAAGLFGGVALYLAAHVAFRLRNVHSLSRRRVVVALTCLALVPLATAMPALASVAVLAALTAGLVGYEAIRYREARARVRLATH